MVDSLNSGLGVSGRRFRYSSYQKGLRLCLETEQDMFISMNGRFDRKQLTAGLPLRCKLWQFQEGARSTFSLRYRRIGYPFVLLFAAILCGCSVGQTDGGQSSDSAPSNTAPSNTGQRYDANSWRELIADDCLSYFDGCNQCNRNPGATVAACTRRACLRYEKPRCLDKSAQSQPGLSYRCDGHNITVIHSDDSTGLTSAAHTADRLLLRDEAFAATTTLLRVPAASGEKYRSETMEFWAKGNQAMWTFGSTTLTCQLQ